MVLVHVSFSQYLPCNSSNLLTLHRNEVFFFWIFYGHNIIQNLNNILRDWKYYREYSPHSAWMWGIFCRKLSVPHNIVLDLNNVMRSLKVAWLCSTWSCRLETNSLPWWFWRRWFNQWQTSEKGANGLPWDLLFKKWLSWYAFGFVCLMQLLSYILRF